MQLEGWELLWDQTGASDTMPQKGGAAASAPPCRDSTAASASPCRDSTAVLAPSCRDGAAASAPPYRNSTAAPPCRDSTAASPCKDSTAASAPPCRDNTTAPPCRDSTAASAPPCRDDRAGLVCCRDGVVPLTCTYPARLFVRHLNPSITPPLLPWLPSPGSRIRVVAPLRKQGVRHGTCVTRCVAAGAWHTLRRVFPVATSNFTVIR